MYKVAVILNESEILRSGYARVTAKLKKLARLSSYTFDSYTVVNIASLFQDKAHGLHEYDGLVITTNATSDVSSHEVLRNNKDEISKFIDNGKGLFITSQKKLSTISSSDPAVRGLTQFLPLYYEFCTIERPAAERDSGAGHIAFEGGTPNHLLLDYPEKITTAMVEERCARNEFRRHFYRSHLIPKTIGAYQPVLVDNLTDEVRARVLLMASQSPQNQERIVVSTVAIDWEFHEELLTNILVYITEGPPRVAFIKTPDLNDGDYDFLLSSARLLKIPHIVYEDMESIPKELLDVHNSYIFSPGWPEQEILAFSRRQDNPSKSWTTLTKPYRRIYYFQRPGDFLVLTHHSTFSTIDLLLNGSVSWLVESFDNRMWGRSFWITHDVLFMMDSLGVEMGGFISPVLEDIRKHYKDGSYDAVMGVTCGLLELIVLLQKSDLPRCRVAGFGEDATKEIYRWIISNVESQSLDDKRNALTTISCIALDLREVVTDPECYSVRTMSDVLEGILRDVDQIDMTAEEMSEVELCRFIKACLLRGSNVANRISKLLNGLSHRQETSGAWANVGRTAHVLVFLLESFDALQVATQSTDTMRRFEHIIHNGVLFLRSRYNWDHANWNDDLQATAKATHAISLFNKRYAYSTQEFLDALKDDAHVIYSANLIRALGDKLGTTRNQAAAALAEISSLKQDNKRAASIMRTEPVWRHLAFASIALLIGLLIYLFVEQRQVFSETVKSISIMSVMVGLVFGLVAGWFTQFVAARKNVGQKTPEQ